MHLFSWKSFAFWFLFLSMSQPSNLLSLPRHPSEHDSRIVDQKCVFQLTSPKNWQWDEDSYSGIPSRAMFTRRNKGMDKDSLRIEVSSSEWQTNTTSLDTFILNDIRQFRERSSSVIVKYLAPVQISGNKFAPVRMIDLSRDHIYMAIAYVNCKEGVVKIGLFSKTKGLVNKSLDAFKVLVSSFRSAKNVGHQE